MHPQLLTLHEVATILRVKPLTVRRLIARNRLIRIDAIGSIRILSSSLEDLIANRVPARPRTNLRT